MIYIIKTEILKNDDKLCHKLEVIVNIRIKNIYNISTFLIYYIYFILLYLSVIYYDLLKVLRISKLKLHITPTITYRYFFVSTSFLFFISWIWSSKLRATSKSSWEIHSFILSVSFRLSVLATFSGFYYTRRFFIL